MQGNVTTANKYYALRHGESEKNILGIGVSYPESRPYSLTEKGRKQVLQGAEWLKDKNINIIIASDLTRTKESAYIVADVLGVEVVFDERLREIGLGVFNGKPHNEYHNFFGNNNDIAVRFTSAPEGGETFGDVTKRVLEFLTDMEQKYSGKNILLVSHGDPLWLLQWSSQCKDISALESVPYPKTGVPMKLEIKCSA